MFTGISLATFQTASVIGNLISAFVLKYLGSDDGGQILYIIFIPLTIIGMITFFFLRKLLDKTKQNKYNRNQQLKTKKKNKQIQIQTKINTIKKHQNSFTKTKRKRIRRFDFLKWRICEKIRQISCLK